MFKRSNHISVSVESSDKERAVDYYTKAFGLIVDFAEENYTELKGQNFSICVSTSRAPGAIFQEFVPDDAASARQRLVSLGCKILEDTSVGFMVEDPFGLRFHVYTSKD